MKDLVQLNLSNAKQRTSAEVQASVHQLKARTTELQALVAEGRGTSEVLAELDRVKIAVDAEFDLLAALRFWEAGPSQASDDTDTSTGA